MRSRDDEDEIIGPPLGLSSAYNFAVDDHPIYEHNGLWYFWDEAWTSYYGPYQTEEIARNELAVYCESVGLNDTT